MGNTILAHALYACNQLDIDLSSFFSSTGNSHKIQLLNKTNLDAWHLREYPKDNYKCVLEVICQEWSEVLRIKLSYSKWVGEYPNLQNFEKFFSYNPTSQDQTLWKEFYQSYKDPSWPECPTIEQLTTLPIEIQTEIKSVYQFPSTKLTSEHSLAEWLTICYYDNFKNVAGQYFSESKILQLQDYIDGNYFTLQEVCNKVLGWKWDDLRSNEFHHKAMTVNKKYLTWLDNIKATSRLILENKTIALVFDTWEQALIIASTCNQLGYDPSKIKWDIIGCKVDDNNLYLENFKRTLYGKTL